MSRLSNPVTQVAEVVVEVEVIQPHAAEKFLAIVAEDAALEARSTDETLLAQDEPALRIFGRVVAVAPRHPTAHRLHGFAGGGGECFRVARVEGPKLDPSVNDGLHHSILRSCKLVGWAKRSVPTGSKAGPWARFALPTLRTPRSICNYVTGAGLNNTNELYSFQCSAQVLRRPLATSSINRKSSIPTSSIVAVPSAIVPALRSIRSCQRRARSVRVATLITGTSAKPYGVPRPVVKTCRFMPAANCSVPQMKSLAGVAAN